MTRAAGRVMIVARDIRAAGGAELFWRASRRVATAVGRLRVRFPPGPLTGDAIRASLDEAPIARSPASWTAYLCSRPSPFFVSPSDRHAYPALLQRFPPDARADRVKGGAALLFGVPVDVGIPIDWHRDPASNARWPSAHWSELSLAAGVGVDVRRVWELSRHRDLFILGRAYWRTADRSYADAAATRVGSWLAANPPEIGINWWSNLEVAMRAQAWVWALHFFADAFDPSLLWSLTGAIVSAARHIATDLPFTRRTMPGNHVIGDAVGLATIALALPELREAAAWRDQAVTLLEVEAQSQIHQDGTHHELSPAYHAFVWELLFGVMVLAERNGIAMPLTRKALGRMARTLAIVSTPDGEVPPLGDADDAVAWDLGDGRHRVGAIAALAASVLGVEELEPVVDRRAEEVLWLTRDLSPKGGSHPIVKEPIVKEPIVKEPIVKEPIVKEPIAKEPIAKEPIAKEPIAKDRIAKDRIVKERIAKEFIVEEPIIEEPVNDRGVASAFRRKDAATGQSSTAARLPLTASTEFGVCARSDWTAEADYCLLRHGGLSKHTHADALNLLVTVRGMPCCIDAGTGSYNGSPDWRRFFRGTSAHSTVQIGGLDQAEPHRTFRWSTDLQSRARVARETDDAVFISGEHNGFERIGVAHVRQILWLRSFGWIVVDRVTGAGSHLVELRWIMPDAAAPTASGARLIADGLTVELAIASPDPVSVLRAVDHPPAGWMSPRYGQRQAATCVLAAGRRILPCEFVSVLAPLDSPSTQVTITHVKTRPDAVEVHASAGARTVAVTMARDDWAYLPA